MPRTLASSGPTVGRRAATAAGALTVALVASLPAVATAAANYLYHEPSTEDVGGCGPYLEVPAPGPNDAYPLRAKLEYQFYTDETRVYYTTDGSTPEGAFGVAAGTTLVATGSYACTFTFDAAVVDVPRVVIPAQPAGTTVRYVVSAWHSGGGEEIFANSGLCAGCGACTTSACATVFSYTVAGALPDASPPPIDGGVSDASPPPIDGGVSDASPPPDAPPPLPPDGGMPDAPPLDALAPDGPPPDAALPDGPLVPDAGGGHDAFPSDGGSDAAGGGGGDGGCGCRVGGRGGDRRGAGLAAVALGLLAVAVRLGARRALVRRPARRSPRPR